MICGSAAASCIQLYQHKFLELRMNNKIIGIVLIIVGVFLAMWGYDIYESAGAQITRALDGDTPMKAWAGMAGGIIAVLIGITRLK
jgi:uncharacterized membrane protein YidH (DUF202 family)